MRTKKYKGSVLAIFLVILLAGCGVAGSTDEEENPKIQVRDIKEETDQTDEEALKDTNTENQADMEENQIMIEVNGQSFLVKLYDNATAAALLEKLPMVLDMKEMNGNEKYYFMEDALPTDVEDIGEIRTGDFMLYGSDCLVLFFQDFSTSYSYTRIGYIEDREGFADALSDGTVKIQFYIEE